MAMFQGKGVCERFEAALEKASKRPENAPRILEDAMRAELKTIRAIKDAPMFAEWINGLCINLASAKPRKH
jgi:hypothetical protein